MEEAPTLRLEIAQGPRAGEALEFKPGKKVGIGRLVRGNTIHIKDNGISSKHLSIEFDSGKWHITDLESSNGTLLNDVAIDPLVPTPLSDGDVVKIGEYTSIDVKFGVRVVDLNVVVGESNVRRNPRRRAAAKCAAVDEKKVLLKGEDVGVVESVAQRKGRRGASKKVEDVGRVKLEVVEDSEVEVEKERVVEVGKRRGRPKKVNVVKGVGEGGESVLNGGDGNEGLKGGEEVKKTRGGRRGRGLKGSVTADDKVVEVATNVLDAGCGGREGLRNAGVLSKKRVEDESVMDGRECDQPLQSFPPEDGNKKQVYAQTKRTQVVDNVEVKETKNSASETHGNLVHVKREKVSICPSVVPENQELRVDSYIPLDNLEVDNAMGSDTIEPLEADFFHRSMMEKEEASHSIKEKAVKNSLNEIDLISQNIQQEKKSISPSIHENNPDDLWVKSSGVEFSLKSYSEHDELGAIDDFSTKVGEMAGLETLESLEAAHVQTAVAVNTEKMDSGRKACEGMSAEPGSYGCHSEGRKELKLEEMTLGQWFDYLEVYLPKQIHDSTEEMIAGMIEKSKRFQEYVAQQQKDKCKAPTC